MLENQKTKRKSLLSLPLLVHFKFQLLTLLRLSNGCARSGFHSVYNHQKSVSLANLHSTAGLNVSSGLAPCTGPTGSPSADLFQHDLVLSDVEVFPDHSDKDSREKGELSDSEVT